METIDGAKIADMADCVLFGYHGWIDRENDRRIFEFNRLETANLMMGKFGGRIALVDDRKYAIIVNGIK